VIAALVIGFTLWRGGWWPFTVEVGSPLVPAPQLNAKQAVRYSGVAQVRGDAACTGWLIDTHSGDGPAYVITNGHCAKGDTLAPTAVGLDLPARGGVLFGRGGRTGPYPVPTRRVAYTSMNGTDVAVLELSATFAQLVNDGIRPYRPATPLPSGRLATNVAVPVTGVAASQVVPRAGQCITGQPVGVIELGWFFDDAQAVDCPGVLGGSSGSPLFDRADRVVGMINTTTAGALPGGECWLNKPCERTDSGVTVAPDTSYALPVDGLSACFPDGRFQLADSCPLPRPGVVLDTSVTRVNAEGGAISATVTAPGQATLRVGVAPLTAADSCADDATYTSTVPAGPQPTKITTTLPAEEGFYVWCVSDPTDGDTTARVILERDLTPPVRTPRLSVDQGPAGYRVQPVISPPELSGFRIKAGPASSTNCDDPAGYRPFLRVPAFIPNRALPAVFCYVGADLAGNETSALSRTLS
jgi:hypothetical protein